MDNLDLEKTIRDCASRGMSRNEARLMLGYSKYKMQLILTALPDVPWPAVGASLGHLRGNASRRGICPPHLERARRIRHERMQHTVRGVTGTVTELARHFGIISSSAARARVKDEGMSVEQAVTMKARPSAVGLPQRKRVTS